MGSRCDAGEMLDFQTSSIDQGGQSGLKAYRFEVNLKDPSLHVANPCNSHWPKWMSTVTTKELLGSVYRSNPTWAGCGLSMCFDCGAYLYQLHDVQVQVQLHGSCTGTAMVDARSAASSE